VDEYRAKKQVRSLRTGANEMAHAGRLEPLRRYFIKFTVAAFAAIFLLVTFSFAQAPLPSKSSPAPWSPDPSKYPLADLGKLFERLQHDLQFPPPRTDSHLLPLLPQSTATYVAFSNYGGVIHQALTIFRQQLQESPALRDWWEHGPAAASGPKFEEALEKFSQLNQFLGDEVVIAGDTQADKPKMMMFAEIKKPGLKPALQEWLNQYADKSKPGSTIRVLDPHDLETAQTSTAQDLVVLVRPDFLIVASDLASLRDFSSRLTKASREFASTAFGQRVAKEYAHGVTLLAAADLKKVLKQLPLETKQSRASFEQSGFADLNYLVWEHTRVGDKLVSQAEVSFAAPRHGFASWIAGPAPLGSLDFVSPKAIIASTVLLAKPAQMFDDARDFFSVSNANAFAAVSQMEQLLKISLKDDLLSHLTGEVTAELDSLTGTQPGWKAILRVNDPARIQQTLSTLLAVAHLEITHADDRGVTYYTVRVPSAKTSTEVHYAFSDGYLVAAPSHDAVAEALHLHASGESLGKSARFLAALPPGGSLNASALFYEDPNAIAALQLRKFAPGMAGTLAQAAQKAPPAIICVDADQSSIREVSSSSALDLGGVLVVAAIAIPNLLRSRIAANEAGAVGGIRAINIAQITYSGTYAKRGFAPDLASLGPDPNKGSTPTPAHAGLIGDTLASQSCTADAWCTKSGYQFRVTSVCKLHLCKEFVTVATPVNAGSGTRSFCSTSDGVIRSKTGGPIVAPVTVSECRTWPALQ
jgi:type II secretory pathway pseudopilin PulG